MYTGNSSGKEEYTCLNAEAEGQFKGSAYGNHDSPGFKSRYPGLPTGVAQTISLHMVTVF